MTAIRWEDLEDLADLAVIEFGLDVVRPGATAPSSTFQVEPDHVRYPLSWRLLLEIGRGKSTGPDDEQDAGTRDEQRAQLARLREHFDAFAAWTSYGPALPDAEDGRGSES
jgi:hypothetical protein